MEAVDEAGAIYLGARPLGAGGQQGVEIVVADNGHGISADCMDRIFEPFFTTKPGTGTGLGLWVAKEIIDRHHGTIQVQPTNDQADRPGASFTITLPGPAR